MTTKTFSWTALLVRVSSILFALVPLLMMEVIARRNLIASLISIIAGMGGILLWKFTRPRPPLVLMSSGAYSS